MLGAHVKQFIPISMLSMAKIVHIDLKRNGLTIRLHVVHQTLTQRGAKYKNNILQYMGLHKEIVEAKILLVKECEVLGVDLLIEELKVVPHIPKLFQSGHSGPANRIIIAVGSDAWVQLAS